jgi:YD repeat-containing protein
MTMLTRDLNWPLIGTLGVIAALIMAVVIFLIVPIAWAQQQVIRDASGRIVSTATQSGNQTTYRDAGGRTIGTATDYPGGSAGNTTVLRDAGGRTVGTVDRGRK